MSYSFENLIQTLSAVTKADPAVVERLLRLDDAIVNAKGTVKVEDWIQGASSVQGRPAVTVQTIQMVYDAYLQFLIDHGLTDQPSQGLTSQKLNK